MPALRAKCRSTVALWVSASRKMARDPASLVDDRAPPECLSDGRDREWRLACTIWARWMADRSPAKGAAR
jgi:hypothetical protein